MNADPSITSSFMIGYCGRSVTMYRHFKKYLLLNVPIGMYNTYII